MGDNKKKWLWISLGMVAGILVLGYIGTALYFMSHFLPNTKVNGKDFSYAKEEDVADYLSSPFFCGRQHGREREKDCPSRQVQIMMRKH